jgi:hypothetical protein
MYSQNLKKITRIKIVQAVLYNVTNTALTFKVNFLPGSSTLLPDLYSVSY